MKTHFDQEILTKLCGPLMPQPAPGRGQQPALLRQDGQNPKAPSHSRRCLSCRWGLRSGSLALVVREQTLSSSHSSRSCQQARGHRQGCVAPPSPARLHPQLWRGSSPCRGFFHWWRVLIPREGSSFSRGMWEHQQNMLCQLLKNAAVWRWQKGSG